MKAVLITIGIVLVLIVLGIWAYLFIFGAPEGARDVFSNFNFGNNETSPSVENNPGIVDTSPIDQSGIPQKLRQLTTRPVAGAVFIDGGIRYAERGTGHIYDIMFLTGNETQVSSVTTPRVVEAIFSSGGNRIVFISENVTGTEAYVGTLVRNDSGGSQIDSLAFPVNAREIAFNNTGEEIFYIEDTDVGVNGRAYNFTGKTFRTLFAIPLQNIEVLWGNPVHVYTTPTAHQRGYLYQIANSTLVPVDSGAGLLAFPYEEGLITSKSEGGIPVATVVQEGGIKYPLPLYAFPEKCIGQGIGTSTLICAEPESILNGDYPDDWYKGIVTFSDLLWTINIMDGTVNTLSDLEGESGRSIDIEKIGASENSQYLYFINKNDDTLWLYDLTL